MTQKELKEGKIFEWCSEDHQLEVLFSDVSAKNNWCSPFQAWFNGTLFGFKTFKGLENKVNKLITKFNLK